MFFRDPFKLVPINNIAEIADKFTRNEILTSNEVRQLIGFKPSSDPKADQLINSNIAQSKEDLESRGLINDQDNNTILLGQRSISDLMNKMNEGGNQNG